MFRRESDCEINRHNRGGIAFLLKLLCNGKESQDEVAVVLCLVSHVKDAGFGKRPVPAVIFDTIVENRRRNRMLCQSCNKREVWRFDGIKGDENGDIDLW